MLLASLLGPIELPVKTHGPGPEFESLWKWTGNLPSLEAGESTEKATNYRAAKLSQINLERIKAAPPDGNRKLA